MAGAKVVLGAKFQDIIHMEYDTSKEMPMNTEVRDMRTEKIIPEQATLKKQMEISFVILALKNAWVHMHDITVEIEV